MKLKEILNYEIPEKEKKEGGSGIQKKAWTFLAAFLVFMLLLSLISRTADSMSVARVKAQSPRAAALEHKYTIDGQIATNKQVAESITGGIRVASVEVIKGDEVKMGDVLFTLDKDSLEEEFLKAEQEVKSLEYTKEDKTAAQELETDRKTKQIARAEQDYEIQLRKNNKAVARAWKRVEQAQRKLNNFDWSRYAAPSKPDAPAIESAPVFTDTPGLSEGSSDPVKQQLLKTLNEAEIALTLADQELGFQKDRIYDMIHRFESDFDYYDIGKTTVPGYEIEQREYNQQIHDLAYNAAGGDPAGSDCFDPVIREQMAFLRDSVIESFCEYDSSYTNAKNVYDTALANREEASAALEAYNAEKAKEETESQTPDTGESTRRAGVEAYNALVESYNSVYESYTDAVEDAKNMKSTGKRSIEDAKEPEAPDTAAEYDFESNLKLKKIAFSRIKELKEAGGEVKASVDGIVTDVKVITGEYAPDGTSILLGDKGSGYAFTGIVTKDEAKYLKIGSMVTLNCVYHGADTKVQASIDEVTASLDNPDQYFVIASVLADSEGVGSSASMDIDSKTDKFDMVIPSSAIHQGKSGPYVLVINETKGVLGATLEVEQVDVTVVDKDDSNTAVKGSLTAASQIVTETNRNLKTGDRVRLSEQ